MERSRGIAVFQLFGRLAGFFTTFVNPIGLLNIKWKWLIVYVCWLAYEVVFIYFLFPETANRTLEELAFCKFISIEAQQRYDRLINMQCLKEKSAQPWLPRQWRKLCTMTRAMIRRRRCKGCGELVFIIITEPRACLG